ncbi:nuclear transport factor 2 family protein [Ruegeria pomeroyi]|nr:nuclear transport factor 2 family protein [Ruegeria pomeroyi]
MSFQQECQKLLDQYVTCYEQRDARGCASIFAAHAELYSPYAPPAIGRQAIENTHDEWVAESAQKKKVVVTSAHRDGDLGWCIAEFSDGPTEDGIALNVLARQPDDSWLITHCSLNEMPRA